MKKFYNSLLAVMLAAAALMCTLSISVFASEADQQLDKSSSQTETSVPETEIVTSAADLSGKKIGVQLGTTGAILADDIKDANVQKFNKGADAVLALRQKKIDCVIIDEQTAKAFVDANKGVLTILPDSFADEAYAAVISKDKPELLAQVNSAVEEIRDSGVLQKIIASYIPEKESDKGNYHYTQVVTHGIIQTKHNSYTWCLTSGWLHDHYWMQIPLAHHLGMILPLRKMMFVMNDESGRVPALIDETDWMH